MVCVDESVQMIVQMHSPNYEEYLSEKDEEKLEKLLDECKGIEEYWIGPMNGNFCQFIIQKDENYESDVQKIKDFLEQCKKKKRKES